MSIVISLKVGIINHQLSLAISEIATNFISSYDTFTFLFCLCCYFWVLAKKSQQKTYFDLLIRKFFGKYSSGLAKVNWSKKNKRGYYYATKLNSERDESGDNIGGIMFKERYFVSWYIGRFKAIFSYCAHETLSPLWGSLY